MSRGQQLVWALVIVLIIVAGYWWWSSAGSNGAVQSQGSSFSNNAAGTTATGTSPAATGTSASVSAGVSVGTGAPTSATVTFNGSGFSPSNVTIAQGGTVTFVSTAGPMWIASNPHPIHNGYDGTTEQQHCAPSYAGAAPFDQCSGGTSFRFTFTKVGSWGYHDHFDTAAGGSVTVVAQ